MKIDSYTKDIAAAATAENCIADPATGMPQSRYARGVMIRCPSTNTSDLLIGSRARQAFTVAKGTTHVMPMPNGAGQASRYDLADIYVKAGTNADDVEIILIDPTDS